MSKKNKADAKKQGALRVAPDEHEVMLDEINRREVIEHEEDAADASSEEDSSDDEEDGDEGNEECEECDDE